MRYKYLKKVVAMLLLCAFAISFSVIGVNAADTKLGSITVEVNEITQGVNLKLIEVADYVNGSYVMNDNFKDCKVSFDGWSDTSTAKKISYTLEEYAKSNNISGIVTEIQSDGKAYFKNLSADKVYLIIQPDEDDEYIIQPSITVMPYMSDNQEIYDVNIKAKFADNSVFSQSAVILNKRGDNTEPLAGATFSFQSKTYYNNTESIPDNAEKGSDAQGNYYWKSYGSDLTTNAQGQIVIKKLPFGTYRFIETQAPVGYVLDSTPREFTLSNHGSVKLENDRYVRRAGTIAELTVVNTKESVDSSVPSTPTPPVKTSDDSNNTPYIFMFCIAGLLVFATIKSYSLRKNNK